MNARQLIARTLLGALPEQGLDDLCEAAVVRHFRVPTLLCAAGERMDCIWLVAGGRIDMFDRQVDGHESIVGVFGPGRWVAWVGIFTSAPLNADITTTRGTTLIAVPAAIMRKVLARNPEIYPVLLGEIGARMQILLQWAGQSAYRNDAQRLAALLHCLAQVEAEAVEPVQIEASQSRLAQSMATGRQRIGQCLEVLETRGLIRRSYRRVEICDMDRLLAFARTPVSDEPARRRAVRLATDLGDASSVARAC